MFVRSTQLDQLKEAISDSTIKVVYGVRRAGKTTLLEQFRSYLKRQGVPSSRILIYDFDHPANAQRDPAQLFQHIKKRLTKNQVSYLFLDELEVVPNYQSLVQQLCRLPQIDLYIASSAISIQTLARQFPCRMIYLGPLRFQEFLAYHQLSASLSSLYHYLNTGGFPFAQEIRNFAAARSYFEGVINTIILNGFSRRSTLCNAGLVQQLALFLADHSGESTNVSRVVTSLQDGSVSVSNKTLAAYLDFLQQGFLFSPCQELNLKTGTTKPTNAQYFPVDPYLRAILVNKQNALSEKNLAIVVFNELRSRGYQVFTSYKERPVTFVGIRDQQRHYFQFNFSLLTDAAYQKTTADLRHLPADGPRTLILAKPGDHRQPAADRFQTVSLVDWLIAE